jgi:hypothetical protein
MLCLVYAMSFKMGVVLLNDIMLNVIMQSVVVLNVVASERNYLEMF